MTHPHSPAGAAVPAGGRGEGAAPAGPRTELLEKALSLQAQATDLRVVLGLLCDALDAHDPARTAVARQMARDVLDHIKET